MQVLSFVNAAGPEAWKNRGAKRFVRSHAMKDFRRKQREQKKRKVGTFLYLAEDGKCLFAPSNMPKESITHLANQPLWWPVSYPRVQTYLIRRLLKTSLQQIGLSHVSCHLQPVQSRDMQARNSRLQPGCLLPCKTFSTESQCHHHLHAVCFHKYSLCKMPLTRDCPARRPRFLQTTPAYRSAQAA
jgi:hypothetical protein